ncbi:phosphoribosylglycinamide formyltransferase [Fusobacterium necrophorum]|uniref:Phosphoribosylglycinamide formyltransferase n=1 Tax=Fusobacterium necrophorum TaxID=859 RepID=A0A4Q2KZ90_9FUSO|nr:phosphoribosylglycinamide formyltransferase [Fusobacterium necrophorum]RXZ69323.1 phosphoribosylglycinamide formyltransferase [Fusobacterium necrophorum]
MFKIAVLVSGGGTDLQSILDAIETKTLKDCEVSYIVADRNCPALDRAGKYKIPFCILKKEDLHSFFQGKEIDLIVLAGYLSILPNIFLQNWEKKIINIHPSLLPKFGGKGMHGLHVHEAVLTAKEEKSGCTVHYVTEEIDKGEIILQREVPVYSTDTAALLQERVLEQEHILLPEAIQKIKEERKK